MLSLHKKLCYYHLLRTAFYLYTNGQINWFSKSNVFVPIFSHDVYTTTTIKGAHSTTLYFNSLMLE